MARQRVNRLVKLGMVSSAARIPFSAATSFGATLRKSWLVTQASFTQP
jgi:hypothetical protein